MAKRFPATTYIDGILAGDRAMLSRAITIVESTLASDEALAAEILAGCAGHRKTFRLGITGVPGVGKSTFIDAFGMYLLEQGHQVAVLAVDPSSSITRGSILGDKTRMESLSREKNAFIRPSPARGSLGGVTRSSRETILLCEAAGYDFIIVETVGVGQSEVAVHSMVDFFLLLMLAGAGDELQGIKKGIMEMADGIAINKADGENQVAARAARVEYQNALHLFPRSQSGWQPRVQTCSALDGSGVPEVYAMLTEYREHTGKNGWLEQKRRRQALQWMHETVRQQIETRFFSDQRVIQLLAELESEVEAGKIPPTVAANRLIHVYLQGENKESPSS